MEALIAAVASTAKLINFSDYNSSIYDTDRIFSTSVCQYVYSPVTYDFHFEVLKVSTGKWTLG